MSQLLFIEKISSDERVKFTETLLKVAAILKVNANWLMYIFNSESGVNPKAVNPNGGATGLIQFMPRTAIGLGTSTAKLKQMTATDQLYYVLKYYLRFAGKITRIEEMYLINFYPYAISQPNSYIIGSEQGMTYAQNLVKINPRTQPDKTKKVVTKAEYLAGVTLRIKEKLSQTQLQMVYGNSKTKNDFALPIIILFGSLITFLIINKWIQ